MKRSAHWRWWLLLASAPVLCVALYLLLWPVPEDMPPPKFLSVAFIGYTNDAQGRSLPWFLLSNHCTSRIECLPIGAQVTMTNRSRTSTNVFWSWQPGFGTRSLKAGAVTTVAIVPPTNGVPWRSAVFATKPLNRYKRAVDRLEPRLPRRLYWLLRGDSRDTQFLKFPTIQTPVDARLQVP